jgi:hypothetical protein
VAPSRSERVSPPFTHDLHALGLRPTHDLSTLGLSALAVYRARNITSHAKTQAAEARGRRGTDTVMMLLEPFTASHKEHDQGSLDDRDTYGQARLYQDRTPCFTTTP